jgi:hypothetical protein
MTMILKPEKNNARKTVLANVSHEHISKISFSRVIIGQGKYFNKLLEN